MTTKPCIECGKECEILPVMLGDSFTLTYLRVCSSDCMFLIAYEYLYEIGHHKDFRGRLYDKQNEEDKRERNEFIEETTRAVLDSFRKNLEANPGLLSTPIPQGIFDAFSSASTIPTSSGCTMKFTRPSKEQKISWAQDHVDRLQKKLKDALEDLDKMKNEI